MAPEDTGGDMALHRKLFDFLFRPRIRHEDLILEWKLNAFHQMLSALLVAVCLPLLPVFIVLRMPALVIASSFAALSVFVSLPFIRNGRLTPAVHLFELVSFSINLLFIYLLRLNDSVYFLFFNSLIAGIFLSFRAAIGWTAVFTASLIIIPMMLPELALLPEMGTGGTRFRILSHGTHFSTAILFTWAGAFISILFNRYVIDLITSIIRKNEKLSVEIDERVAAEQKALAAREFSDRIISGAGEGIIVFDGSRHCVVWNPAMELLTGLPFEDVKGMSTDELFNRLGLEKALPLLGQVSQGKTIETEPYEFRTANHAEHSGWVVILFSPHRFLPGEPDGIVAMVRDLSEQHRLEEALRQSQKLQAVGQLAGGIAHDFNNQLTSILGFAQLLRRHLADHEKLGSWAEKIVKGVSRASDLTQKLLAFASKGKSRNIAVDVHEIIDEVIAMLHHSIDKNITVTRDFRASSAWTTGDATLLQNALLNLALNARDAMPGGGTLRFTTELRSKDDYPHIAGQMSDSSEQFLAVIIADTGSGIPPEIRSRIFEPFFTTKAPGKGTGLGLAAVYGTMKDHQGTIDVDSEIGRGTLFTIALPITAPVLKAEPQNVESRPPEGGGRILLIDDEPSVLDFTREALLESGHSVVCARDGEQGVSLFSKGAFDCAIVDYMMPHKNGVETVQELLRIDPLLKVILCSGYGVQETMFSREEATHISFLHKPVSLETLIQTVQGLLDRKK